MFQECYSGVLVIIQKIFLKTVTTSLNLQVFPEIAVNGSVTESDFRVNSGVCSYLQDVTGLCTVKLYVYTINSSEGFCGFCN